MKEKEREGGGRGGGGGGADTELKTKTPHINVGKKQQKKHATKYYTLLHPT